MTDTFQLLSGFLDRYGIEVEGRASAEPSPEEMEALRRFARGDLEPAEQARLLAAFRENPCWVSLLAREVKALRPPTG